MQDTQLEHKVWSCHYMGERCSFPDSHQAGPSGGAPSVMTLRRTREFTRVRPTWLSLVPGTRNYLANIFRHCLNLRSWIADVSPCARQSSLISGYQLRGRHIPAGVR